MQMPSSSNGPLALATFGSFGTDGDGAAAANEDPEEGSALADAAGPVADPVVSVCDTGTAPEG